MYTEAGAEVVEDVSAAATVVGVKEVPIPNLLPGRTYLMFSHTIKAQPSNMPLLDALLAKNIRLIDYERIREADNGPRLVRFGKFAGFAGALDLIHALGDRLLALGYSTPLLHCAAAHCYASVRDGRSALDNMGREIRGGAMPSGMGPQVWVVTGARGAVGSGVLHVIEGLPLRRVSLAELPALCAPGAAYDSRVIYLVEVNMQDVFERKDGSGFPGREDYLANPGAYRSRFATTIAPFATVIFHCSWWAQRFPRYMTKREMRVLWEDGNHRLQALADLSADVGGAFEFMPLCTTLDKPTFVLNPVTGNRSEFGDMYGDGVLIYSVDNIPSEFPLEASEHFGAKLFPFLLPIIQSAGDNTALPAEVRGAVLLDGGRLQPDYEYITDLRRAYDASIAHVVVVGTGSGMGPALEFLGRWPLAEVRHVPALDATDAAAVERALAGCDLVVSFVPSEEHEALLQACIDRTIHLVLNHRFGGEKRRAHWFAEAKAAGVRVVVEAGCEPGLDHVACAREVNRVHAEGGRVERIRCYMGALPAATSSVAPLRHKFYSRADVLQGLLMASLDGEQRTGGFSVRLDASEKLRHAPPVAAIPALNLELMLERDSSLLAAKYGLDDSTADATFGTLRYWGFSSAMFALHAVGLLDAVKRTPQAGLTWRGLLARQLRVDGGRERVRAALKAQLSAYRFLGEELVRVVAAMEELGLLGDSKVTANVPLIEATADKIAESQLYAPGEADQLVLLREIDAVFPDGRRTRSRAHMVLPGTKKHSALALAAGLPLAIAAQLCLDGDYTEPGVWLPTGPTLAQRMHEALVAEGLEPVASVAALE